MVKIRTLKGKLIVRKVSPFRTETDTITVVRKRIDPYSGRLTKSQILGSNNSLYPVGDWVVQLQSDTWEGHGAGMGCYEYAVDDGTELEIAGNPNKYKLEKSSDRYWWHISLWEKDPFAVIHWNESNLCYEVTPVNKGYLIECLNPQASSDILAKFGVNPKESKIILPQYKNRNNAITDKGIIAQCKVLSKAPDAEGDLNPGDTAYVNTQSSEFTAIDPVMDGKEWRTNNKPFVPAGWYDKYEPDIRTVPVLHMVVPFSDFFAAKVIENP